MNFPAVVEPSLSRTKRKWWLRKRFLLPVALLSTLCALAAFAIRVMYAKPNIAVDYGMRMEELTRQAQGMPPDADNAWEVLTDLVPILDEISRRVEQSPHWNGEKPYLDPSILFDPDLDISESRASREQVRTGALLLLEEMRREGVFTQLDRLSAMPFAVRKVADGPLIEFQVPEVGKARMLARSCVARMKMARDKGDLGEWKGAAGHGLALSKLLSRQPSSVEHIAGAAIAGFIVSEIRFDIVAAPADTPWLTVAQELLNSIDLGSLDVAFEGDRLLCKDALQRTFTDDGAGDGRPILTEIDKLVFGGPDSGENSSSLPWTKSRFGNLIGLFLAGRRANEQAIDKCFDDLKIISRLPPTRQRDALDQLSLFIDKINIQKLVLAAIVVPSPERAQYAVNIANLQIAGTKLMLQVELYRQSHGHYPVALKDLAPEQVSIDPLNGQPFGYLLPTDTDGSKSLRYVLYSYGLDCTDNHARTAKEAWKALSHSGKGYDYVFNAPRKVASSPNH